MKNSISNASTKMISTAAQRRGILQPPGSAVEDGIHHLPGGDDVLDAGCHQQQGDAGCHAGHTFHQRFADGLAADAGDKTRGQPAGKEEDADDGQGIIREE